MTNTITAKIWLIYIIFYLSWWYVCRNYGKSNMIWKCRLFMFVFFKFLLFSSWYGTVCGVYCPGATSQSQGLHPAAGGTAGVWCFLGRWKKQTLLKYIYLMISDQCICHIILKEILWIIVVVLSYYLNYRYSFPDWKICMFTG